MLRTIVIFLVSLSTTLFICAFLAGDLSRSASNGFQ